MYYTKQKINVWLKKATRRAIHLRRYRKGEVFIKES